MLNIAGLGPVFGAISGALWGPVAFLWIAIGGVFAGGVHDYFAGMLSVRHEGHSLPQLVGHYMGKHMKLISNVFTLVLLVLLGTVFLRGPAGLLFDAFGGSISVGTWILVIVLYYCLATVLPMDRVIGKVYPYLGGLLLVMAFGVLSGVILKGYRLPERTLANLHPEALPLWPLLFVTVACGAISGFHATQAPLVARCLVNERDGRVAFYGAMIAESIIAMIWAAASMAYFGTTNALALAGTPASVVYEICYGLLGPIGGTLAILGVITLPITSADTAFRGARYVLAELLRFDQVKSKNRLILALPLLGVGYGLTYIDFSIIWRYFAWSNQTIATVMLWTCCMYLEKQGRNFWVTLIPAVFMTAVVVTYFLQAPETLGLPISISYPLGIFMALLLFVLFLRKTRIGRNPASECV